MPQIMLPRLLLKGKNISSLTVEQGTIIEALISVSSQLSIPEEIFLKNDHALSGGIALFCNGTAVLDPRYILQDNDVLEVVMALSGG